eukprot:633099-Pelagomonas_calceolata.AAC.4
MSAISDVRQNIPCVHLAHSHMFMKVTRFMSRPRGTGRQNTRSLGLRHEAPLHKQIKTVTPMLVDCRLEVCTINNVE